MVRGVCMEYLGVAIVTYVIYTTLVHARRVLSEGNRLGALAIGVLCVLVLSIAVYQLFLR